MQLLLNDLYKIAPEPAFFKRFHSAGAALSAESFLYSGGSADDHVAVEGKIESAAGVAAAFGMNDCTLKGAQQKRKVPVMSRNDYLAAFLIPVTHEKFQFFGIAHIDRDD